MFNPNAKIHALPIYPGQWCCVIDDVLLEPEAWVARAERFADQFAAFSGNAYPGLELHLPAQFTPLWDQYLQNARRFIAAQSATNLPAAKLIEGYTRLGIVSKSEAQLQPYQWICHRDRLSPDPRHQIEATVLYLFQNPDLGGTSFYRARANEAATAQLVYDSGVLSGEEFQRCYGVTPGYLRASNAHFAHCLTVQPRFNRLIFYSGMVFHSSHITHPALLSSSPRQGRLTLNGFFVRG